MRWPVFLFEDTQAMTEDKQLVSPDSSGMAQVIYILYLVSLAFGITGLVGLIMAYIYKGEGPEWLETHYRFQIRTFWIGLLLGLISAVLIVVFIGYLVLFFSFVWFIVRCAKGMNYLHRKEALPNPTGWWF